MISPDPFWSRGFLILDFDCRIEASKLLLESSLSCPIPPIQNRKSKIQNYLDDPVRPRQHTRRNRHADLLGRIQIDDELELLRLLDGKVGGLGAFQDLVDKVSGAPP